jgi:hypothetical protein
MRSNKIVPAKPVFREIPPAVVEEAERRRAAEATAAALQELNGVAEDIDGYLEASRLRSVIRAMQGDLRRPPGAPKMRLRRD